MIDAYVIQLALQLQKSLSFLTEQDFLKQPELQSFAAEHQDVIIQVINRLQQKIEQGRLDLYNKIILHTAPHHDDIILGYHAYALRNLKNNENHVVYLTSGSRGVSDQYVIDLIEKTAGFIDSFFDIAISYHQRLQAFIQAYSYRDLKQIERARYAIFAQIIINVFNCASRQDLLEKFNRLLDVLQAKNPISQQALKDITLIKSRIRESESDTKWMIHSLNLEKVTHFRASFYGNDSEISIEQDVARLVKHFDTIQPDTVFVACDPCNVGPKTHHTTLQVVRQALKLHGNNQIRIFGYRNVWSSFDIAQATMIIPLTQQDLNLTIDIFQHCFSTQQQPIFPVSDQAQSFTEVTQSIQITQWHKVQMLLGKKNLVDSDKSTIGNSIGAIFLQEFSLDQ